MLSYWKGGRQLDEPNGWDERHEDDFAGNLKLPDGVKFYSTPSHGYLGVDLRKHQAKMSSYDYQFGRYVLLEEDCSATMWLAEAGLIPMTSYIRKWINTIPRWRAKETK